MQEGDALRHRLPIRLRAPRFRPQPLGPVENSMSGPRLTFSLLFLVLGLHSTLLGQALTGQRIAISAGHGYYWHSSLGWTTQRPLIDGLIEDVHTNEITMDYLVPLLERAGAQIIPCRPRTRSEEELILDDDQGAPTFAASGGFFSSGFAGFGGGTYRFALTNPAGGEEASYSFSTSSDGVLPVYINYRSGTNRSTATRIVIEHAAGASERFINQRRDGSRWVYVGRFPFRANEAARVLVSNQAPIGSVVVADAVKIGDGLGSIVRGAGVSGRPRWLEASRYHAEYFGAPSSVWNSISGGQDNSDDVTCRPRYAEWWGADLFLSLHTNAGGGSGTSTWIHNTSPTPGSSLLRSLVHNRLITDIRSNWDSGWIDRGLQSANFGEIRELNTMPGCLVELAFHDDIGGDIEDIHHPEFRRISGRALYRAIQEYLAPGMPFSLEAPRALRVRNDGQGNLTATWSAVSGASGYLVRRSSDGFAFDDGIVVNSTNYTFSGLGHGELRYVTVASINAGGTGLDSEPIGARLAPGGLAPLLMVQGFDRRDRFVKALENPKDGVAINGAAIDAVIAAGYPFDSCTNEAVRDLLVPLGSYPCVGWICGEESTADDSFDNLEQSRLINYIGTGGNFFFSGAEVGWDLDAQGAFLDRFFYQSILGQDYVADDAGTYFTQAQNSGPLAGLPIMQFSDGSNGYDVDFPDVVTPSVAGAGSIILRYSTGTGAAVIHGNGRVLGLGFPMEAIVNPDHRRILMERILAQLCPLPLGSPNPPLAAGVFSNVPLQFPGRAGDTYIAAAAFTTSPGISTGDGRWVPLNQDALFALIQGPQNVFGNLIGTLDASGSSNLTISLPPIPTISGLSFVMSALAVDGAAQISVIAPWRRMTIQ